MMKKILFLLLLPTLLNVVYSCKGGGILNANANIEKTYNGHELKFIAFKVYNAGLVSEKSKDLLNLFKDMRMTIIRDTLIINGDNKIVFSVQQADSKQFYNHRYGISNFYAKELDKLGYKDGSNTITFLKPEDYAGQETWSRNYTDMLGLGVIAGKYIFFPCILSDNDEENAMLIYEIPHGVKLSNAVDRRGDSSDVDSIQILGTSSENFFDGKDISIDKFGIDTTKTMFDEYTLPKGNIENITDKVKNPLQDVSNIVDRKPVKKVDSSGEYLMNAINDNKTNYYLDYKVAGYYASDIRNMTLTKFSEIGIKGKVKGKNVRMLIGDTKDAYNFYRARVVEIYKPYPKDVELVNGVPVEQWLVKGLDKNGNKVVFRNFSTYGGGNIPTIDVYSTTGRFRGEIKFKE